MYLALMLVLFQATGAVPQLTNPQTKSVSPTPQRQPTLPIRPETSTTRGLTFDSGLSIGVQLGTQGETVGELREKVSQLEQQRSTVDRPDINSLQESRTHAELTISILGTVIATALGIVWFLRRFLWTAIIPYLRREIL